MRPTPEIYLEAAQNSIESARILWEERYYVQAHYLAGQSVECLLMAFAQRRGAEFDARHNLNSWYVKAGFDSQIPENRREEMSANITLLSVQWGNDQRYYSLALLRKHFHKLGLDKVRHFRSDEAKTLRGSPEAVVKTVTANAVSAAYDLVTLGVQQWQNRKHQRDNG